MTRYIHLLLLSLLPLIARAITIDEVPNVHVADRSRYVTDAAGILDPATVSNLDAEIGKLWSDTSVELVVVTVDEVDPNYTPDDFATKLFEKWKIGKSDKDNGVLILVSRDDRKVVIRTGYGIEGAIPDIIAGRVIRDNILPSFREGNYAAGITGGVSRLAEIIRDPSLGDELRSEIANDSRPGRENAGDEIFSMYLSLSSAVGVLSLLFVIWLIFTTRRLDEVDRWRKLRKYMLAVAVIACVTIGIGLPAFLLLWWKMYRVRHHRLNCPHCGTKMNLIDEEHDNDFLSPSQDLEEKLNSVDYDVWNCPHCHQTDIFPFVNDSSTYTECPVCHTRALGLVERRILRQPTSQYEGQGVDRLVCKNCGHHDDRYFKLPRKENDAAAAAVLGAMLGSAGRGGGGGFGGGGFSGGSFGGGMTGGGGASGSW